MSYRSSVNTSDFKEHPVVDYCQEEAGEYDITTKHVNASSDFINDKGFNLVLYCNCIIEKIIYLPKSKLKAFIKHQCSLVKDPFTWLNKLEELIDLNRDLFQKKEEYIKIEKVIHLIEIVRNELEKEQEQYQKAKSINHNRFNFAHIKKELSELKTQKDKIKRLIEVKTEYLQFKPAFTSPLETPFDIQVDLEIEKLKTLEQLEKQEKPDVSKTLSLNKIRLNCQLNIFVDLFYQMLDEQIFNNGPLIQVSPQEITDFIVNNFIDKDGHQISPHSVRTMLYPGRNDKRPKESKRISLIQLIDNE